ncbi:hypothetical protein GCM10027217_29180 [Pseudomaricurvus hydrocarbonicus]
MDLTQRYCTVFGLKPNLGSAHGRDPSPVKPVAGPSLKGRTNTIAISSIQARPLRGPFQAVYPIFALLAPTPVRCVHTETTQTVLKPLGMCRRTPNHKAAVKQALLAAIPS